ncbi:hypothetical protein RJ639_042752 [Escallonia herrerae]|uniref:Integrase catalytic domain-containing protein n=1 Tax=Escallonia herrerae TaxID=1293975 RepID=A0AA89AZS1_9ASTE|nr:hypothetical protein RJ639_042752 [Escallonia herrerae]
MEYLQHRRLPDDRAKRTEVRRCSIQFVMWKDILYKRSLDGMLLRCIAKDEVEDVMKEVHSGSCGAHQSGPKLQMQIKRLGYYWPTIIADCIGFVKRCQTCQFHGDFIHSPLEPLHFTTCSWPFAAWGMDVIGPFTPPSSRGHRYILAATDYFSKWAEVVALKDVKQETVADFIRTHIIYRFGVPESIIADDAKYFKEGALYKLYAKYNISEAVLPLEVQIPSLRVAIQESLTNEESVQIRLAELESLDEKRLIAQWSLEIYQQRMENAFNKRVVLRSFKKGDLVLIVQTPIVVTRRTKRKLEPKWEGPYVIEKVTMEDLSNFLKSIAMQRKTKWIYELVKSNKKNAYRKKE